MTRDEERLLKVKNELQKLNEQENTLKKPSTTTTQFDSDQLKQKEKAYEVAKTNYNEQHSKIQRNALIASNPIFNVELLMAESLCSYNEERGQVYCTELASAARMKRDENPNDRSLAPLLDATEQVAQAGLEVLKVSKGMQMAVAHDPNLPQTLEWIQSAKKQLNDEKVYLEAKISHSDTQTHQPVKRTFEAGTPHLTHSSLTLFGQSSHATPEPQPDPPTKKQKTSPSTPH